MKKDEQQALLKSLAASGATVNDMGTMNADDVVVLDLDIYEHEDGHVIAYFEHIPGAQVTGKDLVHAIALLEAIAHLVAEHIREDASAASLRGEEATDADGGHSAIVALADLEPRGVRARRVEGAYCMGLVGAPTALIECETPEALGKVFAQLVRMGVSIYYHSRIESDYPPEAETAAPQPQPAEKRLAGGVDIVIGRPGVSRRKTLD